MAKTTSKRQVDAGSCAISQALIKFTIQNNRSIMEKAPLKYLALGGIFGPVLFTAVTLICSNLRPDYNHIAQFISELGATGTPNARFMNFAGFIPAGGLIAVFGLSLALVLPSHLLARSGSFLIMAFGLGMIVVGIFSCDEGCPREGSLENTIHDQVSGPIFFGAIIGMLLLGILFRKLDSWRALWIYSIVSAVLSFGFMVGLVSSIDSHTTTGIWQRLLLATIFLWFGNVGWRIYKTGISPG